MHPNKNRCAFWQLDLPYVVSTDVDQWLHCREKYNCLVRTAPRGTQREKFLVKYEHQ